MVDIVRALLSVKKTTTAATYKLFSWGYNADGSLGLNSTASYSSPVQIGTSSWTSVSAGNSHTMAIKSDGTLWSWGSDFYGNLGRGFSQTSPTLPLSGSWKAIAMGIANQNSYGLGIKSDGTLWSWGANYYGLLGTGFSDTNVIYSSPVQIGTSSWTSVACHAQNAAAIRLDGSLFVWGDNQYGQCGYADASGAYQSSPVQIGTSSWSAISVGNNFLAGLIGVKLFTWGSNKAGKLGNGDWATFDNSGASPWSSYLASSIVTAHAGHTNWSKIKGKAGSWLGLKTDGSLWQWGGNTPTTYSPVQVGTSSWIFISSNGYNHFAIRFGTATAGPLFAWGTNAVGFLGTNDTINYSSPVQIGTSSWSQIGAGYSHNIALRTDGALVAW